MIDFNRANVSATPLSIAINELIEATERPEENTRQYLGASVIGFECLRRIQYEWMCDPVHPTRTRDIFRRGHLIEELTRQHLIRAGFKFSGAHCLGFQAVGGLFRGHADGVLIAGPQLPGMAYPCVWEHKCLGAKGWRSIERDGLEAAYPQYAEQVWLYQAYLDVADNPALLTAVNADTMERLHLQVPFDAQRSQEISDRGARIIKATCAGELLPRVTDDPADWRCRVCGHRERWWS